VPPRKKESPHEDDNSLSQTSLSTNVITLRDSTPSIVEAFLLYMWRDRNIF
jgi:cobalt/nickel transport system permease protein